MRNFGEQLEKRIAASRAEAKRNVFAEEAENAFLPDLVDVAIGVLLQSIMARASDKKITHIV